jgi:hypothetical protein
MSHTQRTFSPTPATSRTLGQGLLPIALSIATLLGSASAQAQTNASASSAYAPSTSYIALNAGTSDLSRPITAFGVFGGQQQGQAYGVAMGNYVAGQNYGYEVGYADFGSVTRNGGSTKVDGLTFSVLGRMPLSTSFNLLGKVGTTYSRTDVSTDSANSALAGSERGFDWSYGIGGELKITPQWSVNLQYAEHFVKYPASGNERISSTTLGARFYY